jgi:single-strand DNA-binding protein
MYSNRVMITGFLGNDAESRTTRNKSSFTTFSVATKRSWKNRETGEYESQTTWHRCVVYGAQAAFAATLLKGSHVQIEGELRTREYAQQSSGKKGAPVTKSVTEIRVFRIVKLDRAGKSSVEGAAA